MPSEDDKIKHDDHYAPFQGDTEEDGVDCGTKTPPRKIARTCQEQKEDDDDDDDEQAAAGKHISQEARNAAKNELDQKLAQFKAVIAKRPESQQMVPDMELLRKHFGDSVRTLWMRLKEERGKKDMSVREAWEGICSLKTAMSEKRKIRWSCLAGEPDEWVNRMLTVTTKTSHTKTFEQAAVPLSRGELITRLGEEEAIRKINNGKFDVVYDSDDEPMYVKKSISWKTASS